MHTTGSLIKIFIKLLFFYRPAINVKTIAHVRFSLTCDVSIIKQLNDKPEHWELRIKHINRVTMCTMLFR